MRARRDDIASVEASKMDPGKTVAVSAISGVATAASILVPVCLLLVL